MSRARILVDQSDPVTARFVASLLTRRGFDVVSSGAHGSLVESARSAEPELILTDLADAGGDGGQLLQALRGDEQLKRTPVIVLSLRGREEDVVRAFEEGADDYVVHPFGALELVARIERLLARTRRAP